MIPYRVGDLLSSLFPIFRWVAEDMEVKEVSATVSVIGWSLIRILCRVGWVEANDLADFWPRTDTETLPHELTCRSKDSD